MNRRGFSLAEVSIGVSIAVALSAVAAGAGSFTMKKAKEHELREIVKDYVNATEQFLSATQQRAGADPIPQAHVGVTSFERFRAKPNLASAGYYTNPYTLVTTAAPWQYNTAADADGAIATSFAQANYPKVGTKGVLLYCYRWPRTKTSFQVWDGGKYVRFQYFMYQAIDERGYPVATMGR